MWAFAFNIIHLTICVDLQEFFFSNIFFSNKFFLFFLNFLYSSVVSRSQSFHSGVTLSSISGGIGAVITPRLRQNKQRCNYKRINDEEEDEDEDYDGDNNNKRHNNVNNYRWTLTSTESSDGDNNDDGDNSSNLHIREDDDNYDNVNSRDGNRL